MARRSSGIRIKKSRRGSLHRALGVPKNKKIPLGKMKRAARSRNRQLQRKAQFAINARSFKH